MIRSLFVVPLIVVASFTVFAACGGQGDSPLSREEYFLQLQERFDEAEEPSVGFEFDLPNDPSDEERHEEAIAYFEWLGEVVDEIVADLASMSPPVELAGPHSELVASFEDSADGLRGIAEELRVIDFADVEVLDVFISRYDDLAAVADRGEAACQALEEESGGVFSCDREVTRGGAVCFGGIASEGEDHPLGDVRACASGDTAIAELVSVISGERSDPPSLPVDLEPMSEYLEFGASFLGTAVIGIPLIEAASDADNIGWYTYRDEVWTLLDVPVRLAQDGSMAEGDFEAIPPNLIVLRER